MALRDWAIDVLVSAQSGPGFTPLSISDFGYGTFIIRPDVVPGVPAWIYDAAAPGGRRLNAAAFTLPAAGRQGNIRRNSLRGFPVHQIDLGVARKFALAGGMRVRVRAEAFNVLNTPQFGIPNLTLGGGTFGLVSQTFNETLGTGVEAGAGLNPLFQIGGPRSIQLSVKLEF